MERNWKMYAMIGLLAVIIVVLLTQPLVTTQNRTTGYVSDTELFEFSEVTIADPLDEGLWHMLPEVYGDMIVFERRTGGVNGDIWMYDVSVGNITIIENNTYDQRLPHIHGDKIVWSDYRSGDLDIWMKDLKSNVTSQLTQSEEDEIQARIYNNLIVYDADYYLWVQNLNDTSRYSIFDHNDGGVQSWDIDEYYVAFSVQAQGLWLHDWHENETTFVHEESQIEDVRIDGNNVVYQAFKEGQWTNVFYSIEDNRTYTLVNDDPFWLSGGDPDIYRDIIASVSAYDIDSPNWGQITLSAIPEDVFGEVYTKVTNDTLLRANVKMSDEIIAWEQYQSILPTRSSSVYEHDVVFVTYDALFEEAELIPEIEARTTYDTNWIHGLIILTCLFGLVGALYVNEILGKRKLQVY